MKQRRTVQSLEGSCCKGGRETDMRAVRACKELIQACNRSSPSRKSKKDCAYASPHFWARFDRRIASAKRFGSRAPIRFQSRSKSANGSNTARSTFVLPEGVSSVRDSPKPSRASATWAMLLMLVTPKRAATAWNSSDSTAKSFFSFSV